MDVKVNKNEDIIGGTKMNLVLTIEQFIEESFVIEGTPLLWTKS